jgi:hypothetical protein
MAVRLIMKLTTVDRERITDSMLKIQSVRANLHEVDNSKIPNADEVDTCLETADASLKEALGYRKPPAVGHPDTP